MKLSLLALAFAAAMPAAFATNVTYSTLNSTLCSGGPCASNVVVVGGVTVTFTGLPSTTVDPNALGENFTFSSLGNLIISCTGGGTGCGGQSLGGLTLSIVVDQTSPTNGSGSIPSGVITGSISGTASSAVITWPSPATTVIGGYSYAVQNNPLALVSPSTNSGTTTIQGVITESNVPEPSTYLLFSAGLLAIGFRRKFTGKRA